MASVTLQPLRVRASGPLACFTRPELKAERVSYQVMTPSAARGLLEAILWKPAIRWRVERIKVLKPIRWVAFRRNEVESRASPPPAKVIADGGLAPMLLADEDRAQRNTVALYDVDYVIEAHFELTDRAGGEDNPTKFIEMFRRRVANGQHFHQPYFGCREFVADVRPVDDSTPAPIDETRDLGLMLYDIRYSPNRNRPIFFPARLDRGVLEIPADPEAALAAGGSP
ncbi:MAG: type I-C CRISPR-associated protein Cas5c [Thermoguttaceae bacterium]